MASETLDQLITRELTAATKRLRADASEKRKKAARLLLEADADEEQAAKMQHCDSHGKHKFKSVPGTGMMGSRFEEKCTNCGWIHTS
jgi:hypothetical protein